MSFTTRINGVALALLSMAASAVAQNTTWVVDANNGAGSNFSTIDAAIAVASPGDVVLVRSGAYSGFTLTRGLRVVGDFGSSVTIGASTVSGVPMTDVAVLAGLSVRGVSIASNMGSVLIVDSFLGDTFTGADPAIVVSNSTDVRIQRTPIRGRTPGHGAGGNGITVFNSRVELATCPIRGGNGVDSCLWGTISEPGGIGLICGGGCRVHIVQCNVQGGQGGAMVIGCNIGFDPAGYGGSAIQLLQNASVISSGTAFYGGATGAGGFGGGPGLDCEITSSMCALRYSGPNFGIAAPPGASITQAVPPDPTLELSAFAQPPTLPIALSLLGNSGFNGRVQQGATTRVYDDGQCEIELLASRTRIHPLGAFPATGELGLNIWVPGDAHAGWLRVFQGMEIIPATSGIFERTNSVIYVLR